MEREQDEQNQTANDVEDSFAHPSPSVEREWVGTASKGAIQAVPR